MNVTKTVSLIAAAGALALPSVANADTLAHPVTGGSNLASGGGWLAWSQPAPDGGFQLALRAPDGTVSVPAVGKFPNAPDPAIGSNQTAVAGRKLVVVYERSGNLFQYDLAAKAETAVKGVNTGARESSPSINFGKLVFVRSGSKGGVFEVFNGKPKRIGAPAPRQVAFNGSRIAYPAGQRLVLHRTSGRGTDSSARAAGVKDIVLTRYSLTFLRGGGKVFQTNRFGGSSDVHEIQGIKEGSAPLSPTANSIAFEGSFLRWYLDADGLKRISTQNLFR